MDSLNKLFKDIRDRFLDDETLIDQYCRYEGRDPLDVITEKESRKHIVEILQWALESLSEEDKEILTKYIIEGKTLDQIAISLRKPKSTIQYRLDRIPTILQKKFVQTPFFDNYSVDNLQLTKHYYATSPTQLGYPHELLKDVNLGGTWGKSKGNKIFKSKSECRIPEYLKTSFQDDQTICTLCKKCKRKSAKHAE